MIYTYILFEIYHSLPSHVHIIWNAIHFSSLMQYLLRIRVFGHLLSSTPISPSFLWSLIALEQINRTTIKPRIFVPILKSVWRLFAHTLLQKSVQCNAYLSITGGLKYCLREEGMVSERVIINISKSWLSTVWNRMRFNLTNCLECHTRSVSVRWGRHGRRRNIYHFDPKSSLDTLDIHWISLQGTHCP